MSEIIKAIISAIREPLVAFLTYLVGKKSGKKEAISESNKSRIDNIERIKRRRVRPWKRVD